MKSLFLIGESAVYPGTSAGSRVADIGGLEAGIFRHIPEGNMQGNKNICTPRIGGYPGT